MIPLPLSTLEIEVRPCRQNRTHTQRHVPVSCNKRKKMRWAHGWVSIFPLSNHHVIASNPNSPNNVNWTPFFFNFIYIYIYIQIKIEIGIEHNVWRKLWILARLYCNGSDKFSPPVSEVVHCFRSVSSKCTQAPTSINQSMWLKKKKKLFFLFVFFFFYVP